MTIFLYSFVNLYRKIQEFHKQGRVSLAGNIFRWQGGVGPIGKPFTCREPFPDIYLNLKQSKMQSQIFRMVYLQT